MLIILSVIIDKHTPCVIYILVNSKVPSDLKQGEGEMSRGGRYGRGKGVEVRGWEKPGDTEYIITIL